MADLTVDVAGLRLENPFILASGVWGETGATLARALRAGAAAVVTKSVGLRPRPGYPNPTIVEVPSGLINSMGLPNPGIEEYGAEMEEALRPGRPVIGSIFGATAGEFAALARRMERWGVSALELNLSCPHAKGLGAQLGQDPGTTKRITAAVKAAVDIPVFVKLTPTVASIAAIGRAAAAGGADALVAINTLKAMAIDLDLCIPVLGHGTGGYSGPGIKPVGVACVYELFKAVRVPLIGAGGVSTGEDAAEYLMAGATALEVGTLVLRKRDRTFRQLSRELARFLASRGHRSARSLTGRAHRGD
ncbi:MAG: dihydroorotate dehydrogenase [Euryarchaeota archaeon]|nr:dihydroorotate dehydrogenase [Euryarchaeota archaeon]